MLIVGGGIAGLWILDELTRCGHDAVLLEREALGAGQTIWSQGIIHGGLKYTLDGLMNPSAAAIRDMPAIWRACLQGGRQPDLSRARVRSQFCHVWRTGSLASRLGMIGARVGLRVGAVMLAREERPAALAECPGDVARLDEQVIDPGAVLAALAGRHRGRIIRGELAEFGVIEGGAAAHLRASVGGNEARVRLRARRVVLSAGNGMPGLRAMLGLKPGLTQTRGLRMAMVRGPAGSLPELYGHCVDGAKTRVTITSAVDSKGRRVWQVGGDLAERGAGMSAAEFIAEARREVSACVPGIDLGACEFGWYDAPRAEPATGGAAAPARPAGAVAMVEGPVVTAWPTKLALAPRLAEEVASAIGPGAGVEGAPHDLDAPGVAPAPWDRWQ